MGATASFFPVCDVLVDSVLHARTAVLDAKQPPVIGFVFREEDFRCTVAVQPAPPQAGVVKFDPAGDSTHIWPLGIVSPRPRISEPDGWKQTQWSSLGSTICCRD